MKRNDTEAAEESEGEFMNDKILHIDWILNNILGYERVFPGLNESRFQVMFWDEKRSRKFTGKGESWESAQEVLLDNMRSAGYTIRYSADAPANKPSDPVNSPAHYKQGGIECIDAIGSALTPEEFRGYCKGNALKYIWRAEHKGKPKEDIKKAIWYLNRLGGEYDG